MNITRRRGAIAFFITLGGLLVGAAIALNIGWILLHPGRLAIGLLGIFLFAVIIAGVVLNTVFLVREIRRNERQDSFLNAVTHELKTPIASIRLYLETLERRQVPEAQRQEFYRMMLNDSDRLLATVDQVLKAGELTHRQRSQQRSPADLRRIVAECLATLADRHHLPADAVGFDEPAGSEAAPELTEPVLVRANPEDLRTAVSNILENSVKYSPDGVRIRATLTTTLTLATLSITDTGVGIPANQLKRVFLRFYRVPGRNMVRIKGTGLGLFIVRSIARQHGGNATASSPGSNQGTTITLTLPLAHSVGSARQDVRP